MPSTVSIDSTPVTIEQATLAIQKRVEERSTASFTVIDTAGSADYTRGMPVTITDPDSTLIFGGFIDTPGRARLSNAGGLLHDITCMDNHYLADKRLVVKSYPSKTLAYIVTDIFTDYLAAEGITIGNIQTGPTIAEAIFNYVKVSEAFDALKELSGYTWFINESKALYFVDRTTYRASWDLDNSTYRPLASPHLIEGNPLYRNKQYVRGGKGVTDLQTENFTGDAVIKSFALGYPLALEPIITHDGGSALDVGIKGLESGKDYYWNKGDNTISAEVAPGVGVAIVVTYYGQYPLIAMSIDHAGILDRQGVEGGSGIVEDIATEVQHETSSGIQESASAKIKQYCQDAEKFTYQTEESGLSPGQIQAITYSLFGFTAHDMLIESVNITADGEHLLYDVTCITGPSMGSWAKFFANILRRQDNSIKIGDSLLLVLLQQSETVEVTEVYQLYTDDFTTGIVNRWLNSIPITAGSIHNVEHEMIEMTEVYSLTEAATEEYAWQ